MSRNEGALGDSSSRGGTWLVTGGAGYIGSHVIRAMRDAGKRIVVLDDLSTGSRSRVQDFPLVEASVFDKPSLLRAFADHDVSGVIHLAAKKKVDESIAQPLMYYRENVEGLRTLLEAMTESHVDSIVFSSSAAVYGDTAQESLSEGDPCAPANPYGRTKLYGEAMISDTAIATGLKWVALRYFNVAGCQEPALGDTDSAGLVPSVLRRLQRGAAPEVYGDDYPTADGTCVRDFVHVSDVASAHAAAAEALEQGDVTALTANIGTGAGASVLQVAELARTVTGTSSDPATAPVVRPRREGDPAYSVASVDLAHRDLHWRAELDLRSMLTSSWQALQQRAGS